MSDQLPAFAYHPDPVATRSVQSSDNECAVCGRRRGWIYVGPTYGERDLNDQICPWCIADGSAHSTCGAEFTDREGVGGYGDWPDVPESVVDEVAYRTPGFGGWQQERWFTHCGDAAMFLGAVGYEDLLPYGMAAIEAVTADCPVDGLERERYVRALSANGQPTGYLFKCRHCSTYGGYTDFT